MMLRVKERGKVRLHYTKVPVMDNLNNWELNPGERDFNWDGAE